MDHSTPDGIEKNTEILTKFGQMFASDIETRIAIANLIQEKINSKVSKPNPIQETNQQLTQNTPAPTTPPSQVVPTQVSPQPMQPQVQQIDPQRPSQPAAMPPTPGIPTPLANLTNEKLPGEITDSNGIILRPVPKMPNNMANLTS